jgi:ABC-type glutathione transport system ATPase component
MNADRIIVVTGGEIVEQGSHEDLIRANGKYAELWSKQIFVKPKDGKDEEQPEGKPVAKGRKPPNIVNDLSPEATSSELAKVKSTPTSNGQAASGSDDATDKSDDKPDDKPDPSGHKKEV